MKFQIKTDEMAIQFTNVNRQMNLKGHSHFALVTCYFETPFSDNVLGFPVFEDTINALHREILKATSCTFRDHTNEQIAIVIFNTAKHFENPFVKNWGDANFKLVKTELKIRGVNDSIGHSDGFATYILEDY